MEPMDLDVSAYAQVMAELADGGDPRAAVLARHGLDEDRWDAIDAAWQGRLSEALDDRGDGPPAILSAFAGAYEAAQRVLAPPITLEQFARVTRLLDSTGDIQAALASVGVTLADYLRGSEHWSRRLAVEPETERRFDVALRGR
jgi:hypothetical protein